MSKRANDEKVAALNAEKAGRLAVNEAAANQATLASATRAKGLYNAEQGARAAAVAEKDLRLSDIERMTADAQARTAAGQAERSRGIIAAKEEVVPRTQRDIAQVEQGLAAEQRKVGLEAAKGAGPLPPKRTNFNKRYRQVEEAGERVGATPKNLNAAAYGVSGESGRLGAPVTRAEVSGHRISQTLTEGDTEEIGNSVRRMLTQGTDVKPPDYKAIMQEVLGPATTDDVTVGALLKTRKRLREAQRVAYERGHKNLARQFGVMEEAIDKDVAAASPQINRMANRLDKDYFKAKSAEWYAQGVDEAFDPATGAWDRKRFTKWWEKHADSTNNDKDLRRLLGDRYDQTKGLIADMQKATELDIEGAAKRAALNLRRRSGQEMRDLGAREKQLGTLTKEVEGQIGKARSEGLTEAQKQFAQKEAELARRGKVRDRYQRFTDKQISTAREKVAASIEKEIEDKIKKLTGIGKPGRTGKFFGGLMIAHGGAKMMAGDFAGGGMEAVTGGLVWMNHLMLDKFLRTAKGASLIQRSIRAVPGTGEAIASASAIARFAEGLKNQPEEPTDEIDTRPSSAKPRIQNPDGSVSSERTITVEADGKHYLIPTIVDGTPRSRDEAISLWEAGKNKPVGIYGSAEEAESQAGARTERLGREMPDQSPKESLMRKYGIQ